MSDLIRREDAIATIEDIWHDFAPYEATVAAIRALPAVQPDAAAMRYKTMRQIEGALRREGHQIRLKDDEFPDTPHASIWNAAINAAADLMDKRNRGVLPERILSHDGNAIRELLDRPGKEVDDER